MTDPKRDERTGCGMNLRSATDDVLTVHLTGSWKIGADRPGADELLDRLGSGSAVATLRFDSSGLDGWDSGLLTFLSGVFAQCADKGIEVDRQGLPPGVQRLLALAAAVPERQGARRESERAPFLARVGDRTLGFVDSFLDVLDFVGEAAVALMRLVRGRAQFRRSDLALMLQETGVRALPIVSLIAVLFGLILAFVGSVLLMMFGAPVYVAALVGITVVRIMGAVMTGIIMAGRTGAAFSAQLGTMQVNEEIDALRTLGVSPMEFLVLPRVLALTLMMPLLCLYADLMGLLGGLIVGVFLLDLNLTEYYNMTVSWVTLNHLLVGLFHSAVFGVLVALAGCLKGMRCGRSASAVGLAVTSAVVSGIVAIVIATAVITVICYVLGI